MATQQNAGNHPANGNAARTQATDAQRDAENRERFVAPRGIESSDLPNGGRPNGPNDTVQDVARRNLPSEHGGELTDADRDDETTEGGLRGSRDLGDAAIKGHGGGRGKN